MEPIVRSYRFDSFTLDLSHRRLEQAGIALPVAARAFDILQVLIENRDRVLSRAEIMASVWRDVAVEEQNLSVQISKLRRVLGDTNENARLIATIPGRGYRFVGVLEDEASPSVEPAITTRPDHPAEPSKPVFPSVRQMAILSIVIVSFLVMALQVAQLSSFFRHTRSVFPRLSIVVLPFRTLNGGAGNDYLADSIADDLTTDLAHIPGSLVIARTSADVYRDRPMQVDQIGSALHVRYVLEGSVRSVQGNLRVNAQLIEASTGRHLWAEHYDGSSARLWQTQTDIVGRTTQAVDGVLLHEEVARIANTRPADEDALDLFFRARSIIDRGDSLEQISDAQRLLERAVASQPDFVEALATLGWLLARKMQTYDYPTYAQDNAEANRVTAHALSLAPNNPSALAARGRYLAYAGQCAAASALFDTALIDEPGNVLALAGLANCAWITGKPDKVAELVDILLRIDPLGQAMTRRNQLLGLATLFAGRSGDAIPSLLRADDGTAGMADRVTPIETTRLFLIAATMLAGDPAEARRRYGAYQASWPHRTVWRQMTFFTAAQQRMPAFGAVAEALRATGMPPFIDEHEDDHVPATSAPLIGAEFTATPRAIPGGTVIDTPGLARLLAAAQPPLVIDVGRGRAAIAGSLLLSDAQATLGRAALEAGPNGDRIKAATAGIVVMGTSLFGVNSYNAALHFIALGYRRLYWYRGGEEAWAAAGMPAEDRRAQ